MSEWQVIDGYKDYWVSDGGQIRSRKFGKIRILKPGMATSGYLQVNLCRDGEVEKYDVHLLVLAAFVGPCLKRKECNHRNGIKTDNRVENLEYVTRSENMLHAFRIGLNRNGKEVRQFTKTGQFIAVFRSGWEAFRCTGINQSHISKCCHGRQKTAGGFVWRFAVL